MNNYHVTKPEPMPAKPNWHYDAYFLSQLERLGLRESDAEQPVQDLNTPPPKIEAESPEPTRLKSDSEDDRQMTKREEVKAKMQMLADSIGISINIIETIG